VRFATCAWVRPASWRSRESCSPIAHFLDSSSNPLRNVGLASFLSSHSLPSPVALAFMLPPPFKVFLVGFGSVDFSFGSLAAGFLEPVGQDESSPDKRRNTRCDPLQP